MNRTYKAGRRIADPLNEPDFDSISKQYPLLPEAPEELWEPIPVASFEDLDTSFKSWVSMNLNEIEKDLTYASLASELGIYTIG
jgi:hypothetical protein